MIYIIVEDIFYRNIEKKAVQNNDVKICDKLDNENIINNCKKEVFVKSEKIDSCN
jgi:hypothetical protein